MNKDRCKSAISHVNPREDFTERTMDYLENHTARTSSKRKYRYAIAVIGVTAAVCIIVALSLPGKTDVRQSEETNVEVADRTPTQSAAQTGQVPDGTPIAYSQLDFGEPVDITLPDGLPTAILTDIMSMAYTEYLSEAIVIKGTVENVRFNEYQYTTIDYGVPEDSFKRTVYTTGRTIVYDVRVDKVFSGEVKAGDVVTIENDLLVYCAGVDVIRLAQGRQYILPIATDGKLWLAIPLSSQHEVTGDTQLESELYLMYSLVPQISLTKDGGYVFYAHVQNNDGWTALIDENTVEVVMDGDEIYSHDMKVRFDDTFEDDFAALVDAANK